MNSFGDAVDLHGRDYALRRIGVDLACILMICFVCCVMLAQVVIFVFHLRV